MKNILHQCAPHECNVRGESLWPEMALFITMITSNTSTQIFFLGPAGEVFLALLDLQIPLQAWS